MGRSYEEELLPAVVSLNAKNCYAIFQTPFLHHPMNRRLLIKSCLAIFVTILLLWLAFGYFGIHALFTNTTINEPLPTIPRTEQRDTLEQTTSTHSNPVGAPSRTDLSGNFGQGDSTYRIRGKATIVRQDITSTLVLSDFDVTNGPDLFVYLVAASSTENGHVKRQTEQGDFIQIAPLKGNRGTQTYLIPSHIDLSKYPVVSIWCRRFSRNFGSALVE